MKTKITAWSPVLPACNVNCLGHMFGGGNRNLHVLAKAILGEN